MSNENLSELGPGEIGYDESDQVDWTAVEVGGVALHPLRIKRPDLPNSMFSDDAWSLLPLGVRNGAVQNLHWLPGKTPREFEFPTRLVPSFKRVIWLVINRPTPAAYLARGCGRRWPAATSIYERFNAFRHFADFLGQNDVMQLSEVTTDLLDTYAVSVIAMESRTSQTAKANDLGHVRTIAFLADQLPESDRMIEPAWSGEHIGSTKGRADNSKEIIHPDTFAPLLWWAQQIVSCAPDVAAAVKWRTSATGPPTVKESSGAAFEAVARIVKARGGVLPQGEIAGFVAAKYLIALNGGGISIRDFNNWRRFRGGKYVVDPSLPQPIPVPVRSAIECKPWLEFIDFRNIDRLQRVVQAAAAVMLCACTGMRGEECLRLPLGSLRKVPRPDGAHSYRVDGRIFKAVRDADDQQHRDGKQWIWATIKPGADAIDAAELLSNAARSKGLFFYPESPAAKELTAGVMTRWIGELIDFANELLPGLGNHSAHHIPPDPAGNVTLDRFRRSVAWHIVNQPEGLLAAGVQFGHMQSTTTEGYASTITSGIAATMDQERTKALYSSLQVNANAVKTGMKASGPAAKRFGEVLNKFAALKFPGTYTELSKNDERRLRRDPDLSLRENPGHGCLCLANPLKPETMACSRENDGEPNRNDCRTYCGNRVYTDQTVGADRAEAAQLRERIAEANPILASRISKRINHLEQHIADHESNATVLVDIPTDLGSSVDKPIEDETEGCRL